MSGNPRVLGIDFGGSKVAIATAPVGAGPAGTLRKVRLETKGSASEVVDRTVAAAHRLLSESGGPLAAVGVSTFGVVRGEKVQLAPNVPGWEDLALPSLLREGLSAPALRLANDVNAATMAEARWGRLTGVEQGVYLNLGTGLGAGIVVDGRVMRGVNGAAGEIAYLLREPAQPGYTAGRAPLEEYASGSGLAVRGSRLLGEPVTASELFSRAHEPSVRKLLDSAIAALGMAVANLVITLDPQRVVVGGGMAEQPEIVPALRRILRDAVPFPPAIEAGRFIHDAPLIGALALAAEALAR